MLLSSFFCLSLKRLSCSALVPCEGIQMVRRRVVECNASVEGWLQYLEESCVTHVEVELQTAAVSNERLLKINQEM